jgi:ABC-type nitrate/sulfonate/bicarbonate transport system permease component
MFMPGDSFESVTVFSLTHGGLLYSLLQRARLMKQSWHTPLIRLILFPVIAWVPLFALSGGLGEQFIADFAVHIRFLITLPILLTAEEIIDRRVSEVTGHLTATKLISGSSITRYHNCDYDGVPPPRLCPA